MSQPNQKTQEQFLREQQLMRAGAIALAAVIVVAALVCGWLFAVPHAGNVDGVYSCQVMEDDSFSLKLTFDAKAHSYAQTVSDEPAGSGSYTVRGSKLITNNGSSKQTYAVYEDAQVLIPVDYLYEGTIPEGDTFGAKVSRTDSNGIQTIMAFAVDGTYTSTTIQSGADESAESTVVSHGVYTRENDVIRRVVVQEDGKESGVPNLFVYEGSLCNYCFRAQ